MSCPFGATASVHNWERVGRFLRKIGRKLLHIALFEYVDDYFAAERPEVAEHAMQCFARVVRAVLGQTSVAVDKLLCGSTLEVLGVTVKLMHDRFTLSPSEHKMQKCLVVMRDALAEGGVLRRGCASKLAGRLQWSSQFMFHRLGRAMIRPIFNQSHGRDMQVRDDLRVALSWWCRVLEMGIVEERFWKYSEAPLAHVFVDACGKSARYDHCDGAHVARLLFLVFRCAAVLFIDGRFHYTDGVPSQGIMEQFNARNDRLMSQCMAHGVSSVLRV